MKKIINNALNRFGYSVNRFPSQNLEQVFSPDMEDTFRVIYEKCKGFSMTSVERMYSLFKSVEYIVKNDIEGDFVECGVWKGGSSMLIADTLQHLGCSDRKIYMYDTYEGMSAPTEDDRNVYGDQAIEKYASTLVETESKSDWCYASFDEVSINIMSTGFGNENVVMVKGKVEETIPGVIPNKISLLRLDTDWYESTYHELNHLYPILSVSGVLIVDDYGHWEGAKKATDNYFDKQRSKILLNRIDYTGRIGVKI